MRNKEKRMKYQKEYHDKHKEELKDYLKKWRDNNQEYIKNYRETHKEESKKYRDEHKNEMKEYNLKRNYGITKEHFEEIYNNQDGKCFICDISEKELKDKNSAGLAIDHDHKTGKIRGLLCHNCNKGLGLLKDDPNILKKGIDYLLKEQSNFINERK